MNSITEHDERVLAGREKSERPYKIELGVVMSNFDHTIDHDIAKELKRKKAYAAYSGWNFCGYVWWDRKKKKWACEIWVYNVPQEVIYEDSLDYVMETVSDKYGYE